MTWLWSCVYTVFCSLFGNVPSSTHPANVNKDKLIIMWDRNRVGSKRGEIAESLSFCENIWNIRAAYWQSGSGWLDCLDDWQMTQSNVGIKSTHRAQYSAGIIKFNRVAERISKFQSSDLISVWARFTHSAPFVAMGDPIKRSTEIALHLIGNAYLLTQEFEIFLNHFRHCA